MRDSVLDLHEFVGHRDSEIKTMTVPDEFQSMARKMLAPKHQRLTTDEVCVYCSHHDCLITNKYKKHFQKHH